MKGKKAEDKEGEQYLGETWIAIECMALGKMQKKEPSNGKAHKVKQSPEKEEEREKTGEIQKRGGRKKVYLGSWSPMSKLKNDQLVGGWRQIAATEPKRSTKEEEVEGRGRSHLCHNLKKPLLVGGTMVSGVELVTSLYQQKEKRKENGKGTKEGETNILRYRLRVPFFGRGKLR